MADGEGSAAAGGGVGVREVKRRGEERKAGLFTGLLQKRRIDLDGGVRGSKAQVSCVVLRQSI